jgi:hypothetical protein
MQEIDAPATKRQVLPLGVAQRGGDDLGTLLGGIGQRPCQRPRQMRSHSLNRRIQIQIAW